MTTHVTNKVATNLKGRKCYIIQTINKGKYKLYKMQPVLQLLHSQ